MFEILALRPARADANYELVRLYLNGDGVGKDELRALELFDVAAQQGHAPAAFKLGCVHQERDELL